jgi:hypothetical protein
MEGIIEGAAFEESAGSLFLNTCRIRLASMGLCQLNEINSCAV